MTRLLLLSVFFGLSCAAFASDPRDEGQRLIEYASGKRAWVSQDEMQLLSEEAHQVGSCGGFFDVTLWPEARAEVQKVWTTLDDRVLEPSHPDEVARLFSLLSRTRYEATITKMQKYWNRYYSTENAVQAAQWIASQFREVSVGRDDVTVELIAHDEWPQPSVIARIRGTDTALEEGIVVGAHEDSINTMVAKPERAAARAPGADDNASGVAAVLEIFRTFMESGIRPRRDLYFMAYAAEEVGLLGSQAIAADFKQRQVKVAAVLNLDMILFRGATGKMGVTTSNTDSGLNRFSEKLIDRYVGARRERRSCGYACSDHASWDVNGYRAVFLFEAVGDISPWWHHPNDMLNASHEVAWGMNFVKAGAAFMVELGMMSPF